ncbi:MAG: hypothetical protein ACODAQ_11935 [Phycisphaeraceae bacterium]
MRHAHGWSLALVIALLAMVAGGPALGQAEEDEAADAPAQQSESDAADDAPATDADESAADESDTDDSDETMQQLLQQRAAPPTVQPQRDEQAESVPNRVGAPATKVDVDPAVLGVAPGEPQPTLRREGEFIVNRVGRLRRSPDGARVLFVFEADDKDSPEPPMILQECQYLETMENIVQERGSQVRFKVSGQVHTYRGANYLLPTMMTLEMDRGDMEN